MFSSTSRSLNISYGNKGVFQYCNQTSFVSFGIKTQSSGKLIYNVRINQNGTLDTTFGTNCFLNWFIVTGIGDNLSFLIQNDDKIILYLR